MGTLKFLKSDADFAAFRSSKSFQTKDLKIRVHYRLNQNQPRFGFIVPKKVVPRVVDRNTIKRRLKTVIGKTADKVKSADILFYPQLALIKKNPLALQKEVIDLYKLGKLWKS